MKFTKVELALIKSLVDGGKSPEDAEKEVLAMRSKEDTTTEEVVMSEDALKQIAASVAESVKPMIQTEVKSAFDANEAVINKHVNGGQGNQAGKISTTEVAKLSKELRFIRAAKALNDGDRETLKTYNENALELRTKAGYANETVLADGGYIVLDPEFEAEVERLTPNYGVALREADVRFINGNSVKTNKRASNVSLYEVTTEGGQKQGTKMTFSQTTVTLREFAAIAIATNNLIDDEAIDFWAEVTQGFAEAWALQTDIMAFTENGTVYKGLIHTAGVQVETVGAAITSITWDDILNAEAKIPSAARANMKHLMHRSVLNVLTQNKDSQGRYQFTPGPNGLATPWGTPIILSDAMPSTSDVPDANEGYVITGDLKRIRIYMKRGLRMERSNEATVHDSLGNAVNLWEKNMQALKAEVRAAVLIKFPEAFVVTGTGTVS